MSFVQRLVVRSGLAINVPALDTAELGWDTDTKTGRFGDGTSTPPRVMTTKSTGIFDFSSTTSVKFNQIDMVTGGKVDGVDVSNLITGNGLLVHTGSGNFANRKLTNLDNYITIVNGTGVSGDIQISLSDSLIATISSLQDQISAIGINTISYYTINQTLPVTNIGPIWSELYNTIMTWQTFNANGANFTGYASHNIGDTGRILTSSVRQGWVKRNGAFLSKTTYAALWNWALHNGRVVPIVSWAAGTSNFADNGDGTFRLPDHRGEFERLWDDGRGADTGRSLGTWQDSQNKSHTHNIYDPTHTHYALHIGPYYDRHVWESFDHPSPNGEPFGGYTNPASTGIVILADGGTETRVRNTSVNGIIKF